MFQGLERFVRYEILYRPLAIQVVRNEVGTVAEGAVFLGPREEVEKSLRGSGEREDCTGGMRDSRITS